MEWLVDRGQTGQWGATPFAERPGLRDRVHGFRIGGGLYIAGRDDVPVGVLVVGPAPAYAPPAPVPGIVRWYEEQGFIRSSRFELNGWQGQIFSMQL